MWYYQERCRDFHEDLLHATKTGNVKTMDDAYRKINISVDTVKKIAMKVNSFGQTPLLVACAKASVDVVKHLIEKYRVDVNQRCALWLDDGTQEVRGTALHAAIISGNFALVRYLVEVCRADVNAATSKLWLSSSQSIGGFTPLHLAVKYLNRMNRLKVVRCLLWNGANWHIRDASGKQSWELTWDADLTMLMISFGVGLESSENSTRSTVIHKWAKSKNDRSTEVIQVAADQGIDLNQLDVDGLTPLMIAAFGPGAKPNEKVFNLILKLVNDKIGRLDKIAAHELIGASFIRFNHIHLGLQHWRTAMELRFGQQPHMLKPSFALLASARSVFKGGLEVRTLQELEDFVSFQPDLLREQALLTNIRILGLNHAGTLNRLFIDSVHIWNVDKQNFLDYVKFALELCNPLENDIWAILFTMVFVSICTMNIPSNNLSTLELNVFDNTMPILRKLVDALKQINDPTAHLEHLPPDYKNCILIAILNLADLMAHSIQLNSHQVLAMKRCLHEAVRVKQRNEIGCDLLLLACIPIRSSIINGSFLAITFHQQFVHRRSLSAEVLSLLLEVGADPHSTTNDGETGLHILAKYNQTLESQPVRVLLEAGTHVDQTDYHGRSAADEIISFTNPLSVRPVNPLGFPLLKCLSARAIRQMEKSGIPLSNVMKKSGISSSEELSDNMINFIRRH